VFHLDPEELHGGTDMFRGEEVWRRGRRASKARGLRRRGGGVLVNPTIVTKLQFVHIKTKLVYIGRRRTMSFNENNT